MPVRMSGALRLVGLVVVAVVTTTAILNALYQQSIQINTALNAITELRDVNLLTLAKANSANSAEKQRERKQVFFDLGANRGDSSLQFVGIEKSKIGVGRVEDEYQFFSVPKHRLPGAWDIRMYEGHPGFDDQLYDAERQVLNADVNLYGGPFNVWRNNRTLIGWQDTYIDFFIDTRSSQVWGSSVKGEHPDVVGKKQTIKTKMVDLISEITDNYSIDDYVIVKMDIEGAEFDILPALLVRGAFPYIDELYVEFHPFKGIDDGVQTRAYREIIFPASKKIYPAMKFGEWT